MTPYPHPCASVSSKKVSRVRYSCLQPPPHLKYRHYRGRPQVKFSIRQPLHSQKIISRFTIRSSIRHSWLLSKMNSPSAPFPINMSPSTNRAGTSSLSLSPSSKIGSGRKQNNLAENSNQHQIFWWESDNLHFFIGHHSYTDWELPSACIARILLKYTYPVIFN